MEIPRVLRTQRPHPPPRPGPHPETPGPAKKEQRGTNSTVVFLFRADNLPGVDGTPGLPCALLTSFGMDGYSTLIWNTIVRLKYPHLVTKPSFVMAEIIFKKPIPNRPLTSEFTTDPGYIAVNILTKTSAP